MDKHEWSSLISAIHQKNCILMLGPDLITAKIDDTEKPLIEILANQLAEELKDKSQVFDPDNLTQVAQHYVWAYDKRALIDLVDNFYGSRVKQENQHNEVYSHLATLPFPLIIHSTFDYFLLQAFRENNKNCIIDHYNFRGAKKPVAMGTPEKPLIYYLYGVLDDPQSLVISESALLDFLVAIISKNPDLPDNIRAELKDKDKCFLFLGFGFKHWYLRILLHVLQETIRENLSFALEKLNSLEKPESQHTVLFLRKGYKIHIYEKDLKQFVKELQERYDAFLKERTGPSYLQKVLSPDAPVVFICHVREDKEFAADLYKRLENKGLNAWVDEKGIYGDDGWDTLIEKTINTEIDYFVILQSNVMLNKYESCFTHYSRLIQQKNELKRKWDQLSKKLSDLEGELLHETRSTERDHLQHTISKFKNERQQVDQELTNLEGSISSKSDDEIDTMSLINKEIASALKRQNEFSQNFQFIIPVKIEGCKSLPVLENFASIDLSNPNNIDELVKIVKKDHQRRRRG